MSTATTTASKSLPLCRRYPHEFSIWAGMRQRCANPNCREYRYYGGRGIRVCRRWSGTNGFKNFIADLGPPPFKRASVHRTDNDGNYRPGNVVWAGPKTQARHMRSNRVLEYSGVKMILVEWAERVHEARHPRRPTREGWSVEEALTTPVEPWRRRGRS